MSSNLSTPPAALEADSPAVSRIGKQPLTYSDEPLFARGPNTGWVFVLDDFFSDPDAVREYALGLEYEPDGESQFPGMRCMHEAPRHALDLFETLIGERPRAVAMSFQFQRASDESNSFIHGDLNDFAAVVYLTREGEGLPGTSFYRHKATGLSRIPDTFEMIEAAQRLGVPPQEIARSLTDDRLAFDRWEVLQTVPIRYNRLIAYDASQFHRNASAWGSTLEDSRLVASMFCGVRELRPGNLQPVRVARPAYGSSS